MPADSSTETVVISVKVHFISDPSGAYTSTRGKPDVERRFQGANEIWLPAGIRFEVGDVVRTNVTPEIMAKIWPGPDRDFQDIVDNESYSGRHVNVFFARLPDGLNGFAMRPIPAAVISDNPRVDDFRATAHELGHLFELEHVPQPADPDRLMTSGENGRTLTQEEVSKARDNAERLLQRLRGAA